MHSPARGRFLCILTCLMMLVPALPEGPVGAGSTHTQGGQDFQNGISNRVSATEEGLELAVETEMPYNWTRLNMGEPGTKNFPHMEYDLQMYNLRKFIYLIFTSKHSGFFGDQNSLSFYSLWHYRFRCYVSP